MTEQEKMHSGDLYLPDDPDIVREQTACLDKLYDFNQTRPTEMEKRAVLLREMFAEIGEGCYIEPPLHANFGGRHVHFGSHVYANFNLTMVDDTHIYVGDYTMLAPNVILATAGHSLLGALRERNYQYNMPVRIGRNCWLGAGVIVLPGVTIGDNTVVGAGQRGDQRPAFQCAGGGHPRPHPAKDRRPRPGFLLQRPPDRPRPAGRDLKPLQIHC